ncbi:Similar to Speckle-type POZ protein-like A; acc. no. Q5BL35 [Pyronema omphalodes CBS 100304]|uniref:Similar to Speckle-type POZ protein-like A acc. no. Q5BL35 n=1 Tax=Pyronema omphalodes (strain CBS 100304) TaxID=1076935 RepID=U4L2S0_PYROM|nr:Similar to Speckle-type POZ protein-like A; acc. no. Q5BL35 [Pyronema omphalodes CBS 100304]
MCLEKGSGIRQYLEHTKPMAASIVHIPLAPMTLEINAASSEYVTWTYRWKNVDLSADFETYSPNFGHPDGWVWRMLFQQNVDAAGNRVYGIFLYVVMTDNELQERTWTRDIRYLQFCILNSEGRQLKDKTTVALYRENQLSWGFPGLLDNSILLRDPVVNSRRTVDIVCRLRYHPTQEKLRRPLSPSISSNILGNSMMGTTHPTSRTSSTPANFWDQQSNSAAVADPVGKSLKKILQSGDFSDLDIVVGHEQKVIKAHKAILAARSDWFRSALRPAFREAREGRINMLDDDPKIFEALLEFLYTGEYPILQLESNLRQSPKTPEPVNFSSRSPPTIPPRVMDCDNVMSGVSPFSPPSESQISATLEDTYDYMSTTGSYPEDNEIELDDQKFQLFLMADKYGVTQLKTLIRLHLTTELLDTSNNTQPGQRLLRLIRFAFEDLPESTHSRSVSRTTHRESVSHHMSDRLSPVPSAPSPFGALANSNGFSIANSTFTEIENREGTASTCGEQMVTERTMSPRAQGGNDYAGIYGRDNETALLRESITGYVAKMYQQVRCIEGYEELLQEGGAMGGFVRMVMDSMFRP